MPTQRIRSEVQKSIAAGGVRSLRDLAREFHHDPKTLQMVVPDLIPALKLANKAFCVEKGNLAAAKEQEECRKLIEALLRAGLTLTLRNAREYTGQPLHTNSRKAKAFLAMRERYIQQ